MANESLSGSTGVEVSPDIPMTVNEVVITTTGVEYQTEVVALENVQEFSVEEQDLDFITLEMSLVEKDILEDTPILTEIILNESVETFITPTPVKVIASGTKILLGKLI